MLHCLLLMYKYLQVVILLRACTEKEYKYIVFVFRKLWIQQVPLMIVALHLVYCTMLLNFDTVCIINIHQIIYHNMACFRGLFLFLLILNIAVLNFHQHKDFFYWMLLLLACWNHISQFILCFFVFLLKSELFSLIEMKCTVREYQQMFSFANA